MHGLRRAVVAAAGDGDGMLPDDNSRVRVHFRLVKPVK
jgi:hypothetical protein